MIRLLILALALPLAAQQPQRVVTPGFVALNAGAMASAALDVATTQRCIRNNTCHEDNPLMKCSAGCMYSRALGETGAMVLVSYELRKRGHDKMWWIAPSAELGMHGVLAGVALHWK